MTQAGLADALYNAGFVAALIGDGPRARAEYDEAIRIYEAIGDRKGLLTVREALVFILLHSGDYAAARAVGRQNAGGLPDRGRVVADRERPERPHRDRPAGREVRGGP